MATPQEALPAAAAATPSSAALESPHHQQQQQQADHQQQQQQQQQQEEHHQHCDGPLLPPRVLSIQSSVVHGYVGNKAAVFPLQLLGFDVDPVNSVQFSNHTGYPVVKGHVFDGAHLTELLAGLTANGLVCHTHLLTGYINSVSLLQAVADVARELRRANPGLTYVCDPVLGDEGKLYVSDELLEAYRTTLLPLADILVPNQFEAHLLTEQPVTTEQQALAAAAALLARGPHTVIITSLDALPHPEHAPPPESVTVAGGSEECVTSQQQQQQQQSQGDGSPAVAAAAGGSKDDATRGTGYITLVASTRLPQAPGCPSTFRLQVPKLPGYFTGTGDLLAALLLARTHQHPANLAAAVEAAVAGLQGVLAATAAAAAAAACGGDDGSAASLAASSSPAAFKAKELRLIQSHAVLLNPVVKVKAEPLKPLQPLQP